ncbi:MAG TPA: type VI secretion system baseplate subunit TssK [Caulobacteraceae bacterium]|jgi:type VI secretion system protein ImpJ
MAGESRVAWREGLFLRPQHFQQQDRFVESLVRARTEILRPYGWGLSQLSLDTSMSSLGKFAVAKAEGAMPDGLPFSIPGDIGPPPPLDIPPDTRDAIIYLTLPARQSGGVEFAERGASRSEGFTRHVVDEEAVFDAFAAERVAEPIELARPNLRYGLTREQIDGRVLMGLARVREVVNGQVTLDERYIPPVVDIRASSRLAGFLNDIVGRAEQRVDELAERAVEATDGGAETFASFLLLQALNRWTPVLAHLQALPLVHPERLYETFCSMAGELATLVRSDERRAPKFPPYNHEDLEGTFEQVYEVLQAELSAMFERSSEQMKLEAVGPGSYTAVITNHALFQTCNFYLAVSARAPAEDLRARFRSHVKIGSVLKMRQIVTSSLAAGIGLTPTPTPPPQIRVLPGYTYFELDRSSADWRDLATAPALGMHIAGDWPDLKLELWWVKRSSR